MFEKYMIMTHGFQNVRRDGDVEGFQFNLPYWPEFRGLHFGINQRSFT